VFYALFDLTE